MSLPRTQPPGQNRYPSHPNPPLPHYPPYVRTDIPQQPVFSPSEEIRMQTSQQQHVAHSFSHYPPPPLDKRRYLAYNGTEIKHAAGRRSEGDDQVVGKKRHREESEAGPSSAKKSPSTPSGRPPLDGNNRPKAASSHSGAAADSPNSTMPAVLIREKKQKACANCRRAKLKCIVEPGEADCVRCRARQEKCIFYPRTHDDDWQQIVTTDCYNAIRHVSHLSAAVHHLLHHLTARNLIPPFYLPNGERLERFDPPERDMALLQGWGAERNRDLGAEDNRKRSKRRMSKLEDGEDDQWLDGESRRGGENGIKQSLNTNGGSQFMYPSSGESHRHNSISGERFPPSGWGTPQQTPSLPNRQSAPLLPPFRALNHPGAIQLTPASELDIPQPFPSGQLPPPNGSVSAPSVPPSAQIQHVSLTAQDVSPGSIVQNVTPSSMTSSSPIRHTSGYTDNPPHQGYSSMTITTALQPPPRDETGNEIVLGSEDPRPNVITKLIVPPRDAWTLVAYFHANMSPLLFGYQLELGQFPYLPEGPRVITPLILGVMCLLASERIPKLFQYHTNLADEVKDLLLKSPAESWQDLASATKVIDDKDEDQLDPELGIGPEEIVAACVLATWMSERPEAATIAASAFKWARGWIKLLNGSPRYTIAAATGIVPEERKASNHDMARIWLLCYIVDGTEALQRNAPPSGRDPLRYCEILIPADPRPRVRYDPHDILLTLHARLIDTLREWYIRRADIHNSGHGPERQYSLLCRLGDSTAAQLNLWKESLDQMGLDGMWTRQIHVFYGFARVLVNANVAQLPDRDLLRRRNHYAIGVDSALLMLEGCLQWKAYELSHLPPFHLYMITVACSFLVESVRDTQNWSREGDIMPIEGRDMVHPIRALSALLLHSDLHQGHVAKVTAAALARYAKEIEAMC
ncbi:hypothetical protein TREMEDRAFT_58737 [Tremella mesenterica DSM 1558]|uniref:uncharacterized protein n=1 Tax=Tremella mesenterica (strain ATCC 24925 / CBS 8224 / DSM 1558 / NBRC 9311 / NRRL Y-6157 / RJB 2259-6 / UBC 559-6) TaxID=578456 RepID=UPI0003F4A280|nr:uncharacterized protein TREMEDRAFT_58737 [Tremella mesenterica DSM 1558]EIW72567.1 hypothetical protein TREMEDRAFT_58737 [Tremella mesenterica DSM 1558]